MILNGLKNGTLKKLASNKEPSKLAQETEDQTSPWSVYHFESTGQLEDYPAYSYNEYHVYIYDVIKEPYYYNDVLEIFRNTVPGDIIHIYINSQGGDLDTLVSFSSAIDDTEALVICHVDGNAYSAAFILAFMGDDTEISQFASLMAHNSSVGCYLANSANLDKHLKNSKTIYRGMLERYCYMVLTPDEISGIVDRGEEFYFSAETIESRLDDWRKIHENDDTCSCCNNTADDSEEA